LQAPDDLLSPGELLGDESVEEITGIHKLFDYMSSTFAPFMLDKPDFTFEQIKSESPLFQGKTLFGIFRSELPTLSYFNIS
jgi:hypothetical protein